MRIVWHTCTERQAVKKIYPQLMGRAFHRTSPENFLQIVRCGEIRHNQCGDLKKNFQKNSFFANIGHVSFCDFFNNRTRPRKLRDASMRSYRIFDADGNGQIVFLFLRREAIERLVTWGAWKEAPMHSDGKYRGDVVPYLESGYPGHVSLSEIEEALLLQFPPLPMGVLDAMEKAMQGLNS